MDHTDYPLRGGHLHYFHRHGPPFRGQLAELLVDVCDHMDQLTDDESEEWLTVYPSDDGWSAVLMVQRTDGR